MLVVVTLVQVRLTGGDGPIYYNETVARILYTDLRMHYSKVNGHVPSGLVLAVITLTPLAPALVIVCTVILYTEYITVAKC